MTTESEYLAALLREKRHVEQLGDEQRLAHLAAELKRIGHEAKPAAKRAEKRVTKPKEEG